MIILFFTACLSLVFSNVMANFSAFPIETMEEKIDKLKEGSSFIYVDLGLTKQELFLIHELKFNKIAPEATLQYNRFGNLSLLKEEVPEFLMSLGDNRPEETKLLAEMIEKITAHVIQAARKNSAWICLRASTPTHAFDTPRWHTDGAYFGLGTPSESSLKFVTVLTGNPTLLYPLPDDLRDEFYAHRMDREFLNKLVDKKKVESPKEGQGVFFLVGNSQKGAIHSEPKMSENRLFLSILPGDDFEIDELYLRWHR
jgi:hypothetical protein